MATRADRTQYTIFAACGLAALAIALLGWALLDASRTSVRAQKMVQHTEHVLRGIAAMRASVALSESSHRGFRLTGDPQLHSTCEDALEQLRQEQVSLQGEVADYPMQRDRSRRLGRLIEERIQLMLPTESVDADQRRVGAGLLLAERMTDRATSRIHAVIDELAAEETRLLAERQNKDAQGQAAMQRLLVFAGLVIVALMLPVLWGLLSQSRGRQRAERRLQSVAESLPGTVFVLRRTPQGVISFDFLGANAGKIIGIDREQILSVANAMNAVVIAEDRAQLQDAVVRSAVELSEMEVDFRVRRPDGTLRWVRSSGTPTRRANGDVVWNGYWSDITTIKEIEQALREASRRLDDAHTVAGLGDWTCDLATGVVSWSPQIYHMLRRDPAVVAPDLAQGVTLFENGARATAEAFFKAQETGERQTYEMTARFLEGDTLTVQVIVVPDVDAAGVVARVHGTIQDISVRKALEERLYLAKEVADNANLAKGEFLAVMSHEIRTPLNGMLGILELVDLTPLDPELRSALDTVRESGNSLQRIIDDILDFSKVEAGKLEIRPEPVALVELAAAIQRAYAGSASSQGLELRHHVDPQVSPAVMVDGLRLRQILGNFVSNAIKFTQEGHVELRISLMDRDGGHESLCFEVEDTGIGISPERQARLFQPFEQAEMSTPSRVGGTGLGLAISRRLARLMGGEVGMSSEIGKGTTMSLMLRVGVADASRVVKASPHAFAPASPMSKVQKSAPEHPVHVSGLVLVVDDHPINRMVMRKQLHTLGYAAEEVESGADALTRWASGRFALVLTDCNMPRMSGYELTRHIRQVEASGGNDRIPIIACSANVIRGAREACLDAGMDDYIPKPTKLLALADIMHRWLPLGGTAVGGRMDAAAGIEADVAEPEGPLDRGFLDAISGGGPAAERDALAHFRRINDADFALLEDAVASGHLPAVVHLAHRIKGACGFIGATGLAAACAKLEQAGRAEQARFIGGLMSECRGEMEKLNAYLDSRH